jgi:hypothetical protein
MSGFSWGLVVTITHYTYPNFLNEGIVPLECKYQIVTLLVFSNEGEDSIMADDVVMPWNPLIEPVEKGELEEASFDVNVS